MHYLYILFSNKLNKFYIGETVDYEVRTQQHNQNYFTKSFTGRANDWSLKLAFSCKNKAEAKKLEKFIKKQKSRVFIEKVIQNPNILDDIIQNKL